MSEEIEYLSKERERAKVNVKVSAEVNTYLHDLYNQIQYEFCEQYEDEIKDLQQKVEQLEKENEYLKMSNPEQISCMEYKIGEYVNMSEEYGLKFVVNGEDYDKIKKSLNEQIEDLQQKVEQLENIRKEAIKFILQNCEIIRHEKENVDEVGRVNGADLLNILNKGDNNVKD